MLQNFIKKFMNDLLSLIKKDLTSLIEKLFNDDVIKNNISNKLTIDYNSKSKQGTNGCGAKH